MSINSFFSRLFHSPITRLAIVMLTTLSCSTPFFRGDIHDAAGAGNLAKVKAPLVDHPERVSIKDKYGSTPLQMEAQNGHKDVVALLRQHGGYEGAPELPSPANVRKILRQLDPKDQARVLKPKRGDLDAILLFADHEFLQCGGGACWESLRCRPERKP
jgi:hypothetical protein